MLQNNGTGIVDGIGVTANASALTASIIYR